MPKMTEEEFDNKMMSLLERFVTAHEVQAIAAKKQAEAAAFQAQTSHDTTKTMERGIELQEAMLAEHRELRKLHQGG